MLLEYNTTFIIAHNLHALKKCDKIIYLDRRNFKNFDTFEKNNREI